MKICSSCKLQKALSEFHYRKLSRDGLNSVCKPCNLARGKQWRIDNPEIEKARGAKYRNEHKESTKARNRKWQQANPDRMRAASDKWRWNNPGRVLELAAKYRADHPEKQRAATAKWVHKNLARVKKSRAEWGMKNKDKICAITARRTATKLRAIPAWANHFFIGEIYDLAKRRTEATGVKWHVDHIVPLQSKLVCGLHVEHNLQVLPAAMNISKNNRYWPEMS